jgi:hypothetical protein
MLFQWSRQDSGDASGRSRERPAAEALVVVTRYAYGKTRALKWAFVSG